MADDVSEGSTSDINGEVGGEIDPRYDRAFQRGFDGEIQTAPRGQSTLRRTAAVNPAPQRTAPREPSTSSRPAAELPATPSGTVAPSPETISREDTLTSRDVAPVARSATPRELTRNPFVIALAVVAAALILGGAIWAYEGFASIIKNGGTRNEVEFWAAQTMSFGAPLAIIVGLGIVAVLLALFARGWRRYRP